MINDTNNHYAVSNKGRIKSFKRIKAIIMKPYLNQFGYSRIDLK